MDRDFVVLDKTFRCKNVEIYFLIRLLKLSLFGSAQF